MAIYKLHALPDGQSPAQPDAPYTGDKDPALLAHERMIIEVVAISLEHKSFISVSTALVNELARQLQCTRVSLSLCKGRYHSPLAISNSAGVNAESELIKYIEAAMNEARDQKTRIVYPADKENALLITTAHEKLSRLYAGQHICTVLLSHQHEIIGSLILERPADRPFDEHALFFCQRVALLIAPLLLLKYEEEHWLLEHGWGAIKRQWARLISHGHYTEKTLYGLAALMLLVMLFATGNHRVSGEAVLEGRVQRMITSPIDGFISEVHVRAGDIVKTGQLLARLDDRELQLQQMKLQGEYDGYSREYRDARAKYDLTQVSVISAKMQQAKAELDIVNEQLRRLQMSAPFDGVVVEGNLEQALGSPVERGQVLLKLAPLDDYRIILKIDDRDIAMVTMRQKGQLTLASLPDEVMPFMVKNITPVSIAEGGRNYFKVEAQLEQNAPLLRPGMHGIAKIEVGRRKLFWIWTHRFTDWLGYQLWAL